MAYAQEEIKPYGNTTSKREQVQRMFDNIAHSYDALNHTLSFGVDRWWRQCAINYLKKHCKKPKRILDIATGTGDFAILAYSELMPEQIVGCDISEEMMKIGRRKVESAGFQDNISFQYEDCSNLSFPEATFDAVISAFALRNFENLDKCMTEMRRVLTDTGHFVAIDLCTPDTFPMKQLFGFYKKTVMPAIGKRISNDNSAYTYLPHTMDAVPRAKEMQRIIEKAGFHNVNYKRLAFGLCILYTATK